MCPVDPMLGEHNEMRVSVVIPAYNAARFLAETIESVRQQTIPVHEIIVVDDGSTDATQQIVHSLGGEIIYIRQANAGVSAARNRGISASTGEYIAFLDADDLWLPQKMENQLQVFLAHPEVAMVASDRADIDAGGGVLLDSLFKKQGLIDLFSELRGKPIPNAFSRLVQLNFIPTSSAVVRKSALEQVGVFDTTIRYGEDLELWARIASQYPIACLPEVLIRYRQHGNNATQATEKLLTDMVRVMQRIRTWGNEPLRNEGLIADKAVAHALWELGYWHFHSAMPHKARESFFASFREQPSLRALVYACLSFLPAKILKTVRSIKQQTIG